MKTNKRYFKRNRPSRKTLKQKHMRKIRNLKGGLMTTSVDTNPYAYAENEYKEMNELALLKGGVNTGDSTMSIDNYDNHNLNTSMSISSINDQGPMTLDELNVSNVTDAQDPFDFEFEFIPDEEDNMNNQTHPFPHPQSQSQYTDVESVFSSQNSNFPNFSSQSTIGYESDVTLGGKRKMRKTRKMKKPSKKHLKKSNKRRHRK